MRDPDQRNDFIQDLKTKIGDQTMMHRIAREENQPTGRRPAFSTTQAIAKIRSVRNDVTLCFETFWHQALLHRVEYLAIDDSSTQGARVARGNAKEEARTQNMLGRCTVVRRDSDCAVQFGIRRRGISQGLGAATTTIQRVFSTLAHFAHHA